MKITLYYIKKRTDTSDEYLVSCHTQNPIWGKIEDAQVFQSPDVAKKQAEVLPVMADLSSVAIENHLVQMRLKQRIDTGIEYV